MSLAMPAANQIVVGGGGTPPPRRPVSAIRRTTRGAPPTTIHAMNVSLPLWRRLAHRVDPTGDIRDIRDIRDGATLRTFHCFLALDCRQVLGNVAIVRVSHFLRVESRRDADLRSFMATLSLPLLLVFVALVADGLASDAACALLALVFSDCSLPVMTVRRSSAMRSGSFAMSVSMSLRASL